MNEDYMFEEEINEQVQPEFTTVEEPKRKSKLAIISCILGVFSLVFFMSFFNVITAVISIILAIIFLATSSGKQGKGIAITGILASIISIFLCIVSWSLIFSNINHFEPLYDEILELYGLDMDIDTGNNDSQDFKEIIKDSSDDLNVDDTL